MTPGVKSTPTRGRGRPSEGARKALIEAATELFIERDFDQVSTEDVIGRAGVSRGAMYHHFQSKLELFRAVYETTERRTMLKLAQAALDADGPYEALLAGSRAYLREAETNDELRRIGLTQSRAVLGWERWREIASGLGIGLVEASLQAAVDAGEIKLLDVPTTALLVLGAMMEGAMLVATSEDPKATRKRVEPVIDGLIESLRA